VSATQSFGSKLKSGGANQHSFNRTVANFRTPHLVQTLSSIARRLVPSEQSWGKFVGHQFLEFLVTQSNQFQREPYCRLCGNSLIFIDATFWIDGESEACMIPLPVCPACGPEIRTKKSLPI